MANDPDGPNTPMAEDASISPLPVLFADSIANFAIGGGTFRTYFVRSDPAPIGDPGKPSVSIVAQLIMPISGFVGLAVVFEERLRDMISRNEISAQYVDGLREQHRKGLETYQQKTANAPKPDSA